jgi:hypothetical protein
MQINDAGHKSRLKRLPQRVTAGCLSVHSSSIAIVVGRNHLFLSRRLMKMLLLLLMAGLFWPRRARAQVFGRERRCTL